MGMAHPFYSKLCFALYSSRASDTVSRDSRKRSVPFYLTLRNFYTMAENNRDLGGQQSGDQQGRPSGDQDLQRTTTGQGQQRQDSDDGVDPSDANGSSPEEDLNRSTSGGQQSGSLNDDMGSSAGSR